MELDGLLPTVMPLPAVTLTFGLLTKSLCLRLRYKHAVKLPPIVTKILYSPGFRIIACSDYDL